MTISNWLYIKKQNFKYNTIKLIRKIILKYLGIEKEQIWELRGKEWKYRWPVKITSFCDERIYFDCVDMCSRGNIGIIEFCLKYRKLK